MRKSSVRKGFINIGTDTTPMWFNINHIVFVGDDNGATLVIANSKRSSTKLSVDEVLTLISRAERL